MSKPFRFASAASLVTVATMIAGCAVPQSHASSSSAATSGEVGLATRAMAALNSNDIPAAIDFAERAVEKTPDDATFRALLGNAYFAGGRFASAEAAFKDSLAIDPTQSQVILKLALVQIAQGKNGEAVTLLSDNDNLVDPADYGLALALAGRPADAVSVLESVARAPGADSRVRQNLALAYAFTGDWNEARTVAAQDVPAGQLDERIHQWMQLAKPTHAFDQVAALTGVVPAAVDPGQPVKLALRKSDTRQAQAQPVQVPAPAFSPQTQVAEAAPVVPAPQPQVAEVAPPPVDPARVPAQVAEATPAPAFAPAPAVALNEPVKPTLASVTVKLPAARPLLRLGKSNAVLQLGAYSSRERVAAAWAQITKRHPRLRAYTPMTARFDGPKGTVYRLAIKGFSSQQEAVARCSVLKGNGGACFVRNVAGDAPIQLASR
jgi:Flp pilus assembly protein TadD